MAAFFSTRQSWDGSFSSQQSWGEITSNVIAITSSAPAALTGVLAFTGGTISVPLAGGHLSLDEPVQGALTGDLGFAGTLEYIFPEPEALIVRLGTPTFALVGDLGFNQFGLTPLIPVPEPEPEEPGIATGLIVIELSYAGTAAKIRRNGESTIPSSGEQSRRQPIAFSTR